MRRVELEIHNKEQIKKIIDSTHTIRLGMIADGMPYVVPFVFGYSWEDEYPIFFMHSGMSGRKNQGLTEGARVVFEIDLEGPLMTTRTNFANNFSREFSCIMGEGTIRFARSSEEKQAFFSYIMQKETGKNSYDYQPGWLALTKVFYLKVDRLSASQKGMKGEI